MLKTLFIRQSGKHWALQVIDTLCTECANLIENHEKIQVLSAVHYNLGKTLQDVENIVALPHEASSAEAMLEDDVKLLQVAAFKASFRNLALRSWWIRHDVFDSNAFLNVYIASALRSSFRLPLVTLICFWYVIPGTPVMEHKDHPLCSRKRHWTLQGEEIMICPSLHPIQIW